MRATLLEAWPWLSAEFGLYPWDVDRLSRAELDVYVDALNAIARARK